MGKESKLSKVLELFFNEPSKYWHFKDIVKNSKISENRANFWLKKLQKEEIIQYHKIKGKMPYYTAYFESMNYKSKKKIYTLQQLYQSGFLTHLDNLQAQTIVIFGSFSRADWHTKSDIDLFILGEDKNLEKSKYEKIFHREIQLFTFNTIKEVKKANPYLVSNIVNGYFVKGNVQNIIGESNA